MTDSPFPKTSTKPRRPGSLKEATDMLVNAVGGQTKSAELSRMSRTVIARYTDSAETDRYMPADVVRDLEARADYPYVTAYLAHEAGYQIDRISDDGTADADAGAMAHALKLSIKECADLTIIGLGALVDGVVSVSEARDIIKEADEAMKAIMTVRDNARAAIFPAVSNHE